MKQLGFALVLLPAIFLAWPSAATGLYECAATDRAAWKSTDQVKDKLKVDGWSVRHVKEDGGCYEAYGTSPEGQRVEAYVHPVTLEVMLIARRGEILFRKEQ